MNIIKKEEILKILASEIIKIKLSAQKADEASKINITSWKTPESKYQTEAAKLANKYMQKLEMLKEELKGASDRILQVVEPPCFLKIKYDDGGITELFLVENAVSLPGISFISADSPLGKSVIGKKREDYFDYELEKGKKYSGKILVLE